MLDHMLDVLLEGKKQVQELYLDSGKVPKDIFVKFDQADMTKNKKYLEWMCREYGEYGERWQHIIDTMRAFEGQVRRKKITGQDSDIYRHNMEEADELASAAAGVSTKSEEKKDIKTNQIEVILDNEDLLIISPLTREASLLYGKDTTWCTAAKATDSHWNSYWRNGTKLYYIIMKKRKDRERKRFAIAVSPNGSKSCYDEEDKHMEYNKCMKEVGLSGID